MDDSLDSQSVRKYIDSLLEREVPARLIQRKLQAIARFLKWAHDKGRMSHPEFISGSNILNQMLKQFQPGKGASSLLGTRLNGILRKLPLFGKRHLKLSEGSYLKSDSPPYIHQDQNDNKFGFTPAKLGPQHYVGIALVLVLMAALGAGAFNQFFNKAQTPFAFPSKLTKPSQRYVSFQGRVTDSLGNPITTATNFQFNLYNAKTGGSSLFATGACSLIPDQDGILNVLVGGSGLTTDQNVCGTGIPENIFSDFPNVYLGITIGADIEATPRQQIANVGYAVNAETLQGFPPGTDKSTIPYLNADGDVLIATSGAGIKSLYESANFTIASSNNLVLQSAGPAAGAGDIILQATGSGALRFRTGGSTDTQTRLFIANGGGVGIGTTSPTSKLHVTGAVTGKALSIFDETGDQAPLTASESGKPVFTIAHPTGTIVNGLTLTPSISGSGVTLASTGDDTNIALSINGKGTGALNLNTTNTGNVAIGNSTGTFALTSSGGLNVTTGGALTGVASLDTITTSGTALTFTSTAPTISVSTTATGISLEAGTSGIITIGGVSTGGVNIAGSGTGDVNLAGGSGSTGCTVTNSNGNLACTGSITGSSSGTQGYWSRSGTTLSPSTAGDAITTSGNISTSGTGTITSAGNLTASNGLTLTTGALSLTSTSGTAALTLTSSTTAFNVQSGLFDIDTTNSKVGIGTTSPTSKLHVTGAVKGKVLSIFDETGDQAPLTASESGKPVFTIAHPTGTIVNGLTLTPTVSGGPVTLASSGDDANIGLTLNSAGAFPITLDSTTTGAVNIGNNANAKTITIGNSTGATALNLTSGTGSQTHTSSVDSGGTTLSAFVFNGSALTTGTLMRLTSTSTSGILIDENATNTTGTINKLVYGASKTQGAGALTGSLIDLNTNLTTPVAGQNVTGIDLRLPTASTTSNDITYSGYNLTTVGTITHGTAGSFVWNGANITTPNITQNTNGSVTANGALLTIGTITTAGTQNGVKITPPSTTNASGTTNAVNIGNITTSNGTDNAINIGTGWDNDIIFNNASPTIKFAAADNTTNLSIVDVSANNLLAMRDLSTNFGAAVTSGAFISRNSYYGDEFMNFHPTSCSQSTTTTNGHPRGDFGAPGVACNTSNGGEISISNVLGVGASGNTCTESSQNIANGAERIGATSTTTASNTATCLEFLGANNAGTTAYTPFLVTNLPLVVAKVRPSVTSGSTSDARFFIGLGDKVTANGQMPNNGIFFSNCSTIGASPTCTNTTWQGVVTSGGAIVGSVQSCTAGADTGTINTTNFNYLRIEVRSATDIHFFVDTDTSNGIKETECGTGVTGPGGTPLSIMMESAVMSNIAVTENLDIDYIRVWQDDNAPATGVSSLPPLEAEQVPNFSEQSSITQDYLINNFTPIPGSLVALDTQSSTPTVKLSNREYDPHLAGVVASNSGVDLSNGTIKGAVKVATHGRVAVRVSDENGPIRIGDYLTSSASRPGFAMRATKPGIVLGTALSAYSGGDLNQVLIEVNRTYQDPDVELTSSGDLKIALNQQNQKNDGSQKYNLFSSAGEVIKRIGAYSELAVSYVRAGVINAQEIIAKNITSTEKIISPVIEVTDLKATGEAQLNQISTNVIKPQNKDVTIDLSSPAFLGGSEGSSSSAPLDSSNPTQGDNTNSGPLAKIIIKGLNGKTASTIDAAGNATFSGTLAAAEATISGTLAASQVKTNEASISGKLIAKEIESDTISELKNRLTLAAADSGQAKTTSQELSSSVNNIQALLADIRKQPLLDPQYYQNLNNNPALGSLTVSGDTTLYNAKIANSLTAGTISIENNQLLSMTQELKLSALSSVNILDGAVVIARDGTITAAGTIIAKGGIKTNTIQPINPGGSVQIDNLSTNKLTISDKYLEATNSATIATPEENFNRNGLFASAIETEKQTAGVGVIPIDTSEIVIYNQTVKDTSLIYLTPTTQTGSQLTVSQKLSCDPQSPSNCKPYFKIVSSQPVHPDIGFNWLIIN